MEIIMKNRLLTNSIYCNIVTQYPSTELKTSGLTVFQCVSHKVVSKCKFGEQLIQLKIN